MTNTRKNCTLASRTARKSCKRRAFNLVEVTLAVAIAGIAIAVLLGLFPVGLRASRDAADNATAATVAMDILNTFQGAGATNFTNVNLDRFGTMTGSTFTVYYANPTFGTVSGSAGTYMFNLQSPWTSSPTLSSAASGSTGTFILFFDARGMPTSNTGTGTGTLPGELGVGSLARTPYFRAEITINNNQTLGNPLGPNGSLSQIVVEMRWPCIAMPGPNSGWRPRIGGPTSSGTLFTDRTKTYITEVTPLQ